MGSLLSQAHHLLLCSVSNAILRRGLNHNFFRIVAESRLSGTSLGHHDSYKKTESEFQLQALNDEHMNLKCA